MTPADTTAAGRHEEPRSRRRAAATARRSRILELLDDRPSVRVSSLAASLGVSQMTVRRDLDALDSEGLARRAFGGALRRP
jgi:DeoR/GlpR family transcriptional regulator of sugar metabolism